MAYGAAVAACRGESTVNPAAPFVRTAASIQRGLPSNTAPKSKRHRKQSIAHGHSRVGKRAANRVAIAAES